MQVVEAEPGEGLLQAPRDLVKLAEPVMENLRHTAGGQHGTVSCVKCQLSSVTRICHVLSVKCYAYGSSEYLGGVHPMAQFPFSLLTQMV